MHFYLKFCLKRKGYILMNFNIAIERNLNLADKITMHTENGAKTVILPLDNLTELTNGPASDIRDTDVPFYSNNRMLMQKGILGSEKI